MQAAEQQAEAAKKLSVPGPHELGPTQLPADVNMRVEGTAKVANLVRTALGGQAQQATTSIAGAMEIFLASDVVYSQRVVPLIQQTLAANGISGESTHPKPLPAQPRLAANRHRPGASSPAATRHLSGADPPGTHGALAKGVSVGTNTLAPARTLNHVSGGANPTFTVMVENAGSNPADRRQGRHRRHLPKARRSRPPT